MNLAVFIGFDPTGSQKGDSNAKMSPTDQKLFEPINYSSKLTLDTMQSSNIDTCTSKYIFSRTNMRHQRGKKNQVTKNKKKNTGRGLTSMSRNGKR